MSSPQGIHYRRMQAADLVGLKTLLPSLLTGNWSLLALKELLLSPHQCRLLGSSETAGSQILGFAEFVLVAGECQLFNIAIAPEVRGAGLGRYLLEQVLKEAREAQCEQCFLEVRASNDAAIGLYVNKGFEMTGVRKAYYPALATGGEPENALLYSLKL